MFGVDEKSIKTMIGLELVEPNGDPDGNRAIKIVKRALADGIILLGGGPDNNVLSFTPPFSISEEEIDFVVNRIKHYITTSV